MSAAPAQSSPGRRWDRPGCRAVAARAVAGQRIQTHMALQEDAAADAAAEQDTGIAAAVAVRARFQAAGSSEERERAYQRAGTAKANVDAAMDAAMAAAAAAAAGIRCTLGCLFCISLVGGSETSEEMSTSPALL